ncbi:MAG: purine-nucleoside phosphorylase, partial [Chthoniobacterales bacterium]
MAPGPLEQLRAWGAEVAIVLGSGLGTLGDELPIEARLSYAAFDHLPRPTVAGHTGEFSLSAIGDTRLILARGRVHLYEGYSAREVTAGIRLLAGVSVKHIILTNAAGTANPAFASGSWMMIADHLNLTGTTPLLGVPEFIDMTEAYAPSWRQRFRAAAVAAHVTLHEGVYAGVLGPQYETPAEVRMLQYLGA